MPALVAAKAAGATLRELAAQYHVTRERMRQILAGANVDEATRIAMDSRKQRRKPRGFNSAHLRRWLLECGYRHCAYGRHVVCAATYGKCKMCKECNRERVRAWAAKAHPEAKRRPEKTVRLAAKRRWPVKRQRPSRSTGYRSDPERHKKARSKVSPERRREIAQMGADARKKNK